MHVLVLSPNFVCLQTKSKIMNLCVFKQPDDNLFIYLGNFQNDSLGPYLKCPHSQDMRIIWDFSDHIIQTSQFRARSLCFRGEQLDGGNVDG